MNRHTEALILAMSSYSYAFERYAAVFDRILDHPEGELCPVADEEMTTLVAAANATDSLEEAVLDWMINGAEAFLGLETLASLAQVWDASEQDWRSDPTARDAARERLMLSARDVALKIAAVN